ncbi:hypothetical protein FSARC_5279 [Fusarium sarcochroum]|uniref:C2H2-type domain-containing protein n=1 Tax=Fusarium sarcochroum TaxID=1208366 RepID=A0A8H4U068_9HYPO|nr:hypothetical protein FSARC_5279 [Fusarium sarcochroum]
MDVTLNLSDPLGEYLQHVNDSGPDVFSQFELPEVNPTTHFPNTYSLLETESDAKTFHGAPRQPSIDRESCETSMRLSLTRSCPMAPLTLPNSSVVPGDASFETTFTMERYTEIPSDFVDTEDTSGWNSTKDWLLFELFEPQILSLAGSKGLDQRCWPLADSSQEPRSSTYAGTQKTLVAYQEVGKRKRTRKAPRHKLHSKSGHSKPVIVRNASSKCDYPGCSKAFQRSEHLKRHKKTFHGEGPNRFSCEFCGKDQFNRSDNLNCHRKLHARPNSHKRGVEFIPAAVPVIEQEERSKKRRAPPKFKASRRHGK